MITSTANLFKVQVSSWLFLAHHLLQNSFVVVDLAKTATP